MIGIIYKFTIIAKYKYDGHKPFYVGQHWCESADNFLCRNYSYYGSGSIWNDFLNRLKKDYPNHWRKFIRREILYIHECSQKALDKLEEYYIKKCKAHYSYKQGGCNVLWGTANKFGSGSPMKDPMIAEKCGNTLHVRYAGKNSWNYGKKMSIETRKKLSKIKKGSRGPNIGKKFSDDIRRKMSEAAKIRLSDPKNNPMYGKRHSEETRIKMKEKWILRKKGLQNEICL